MNWQVRIAKVVLKALAKIPTKDRVRILNAISEFELNPFTGDISRLQAGSLRWRRRVGSYRIFFNINTTRYLVEVVAVERRTTTTY